jgi:PBP1b-binding outer membrane lipoprotein LpoB
MRLFTLLVICMLLSGCQSTQQGDSDFYTWVDETGQVRTVQKQKVNTEAVLQEPINKSQKRADFNPIDFTPSEDVEKKLNNDRLFAWQDASGAQVVREESHVVVDLPKKNISTNEVNRRKFKEFRLGVQVVFNEIDGVAFDLFPFSDDGFITAKVHICWRDVV